MSNYPTTVDDQTSLYNPADSFSTKPLLTTLAASCTNVDSTIQLAATVSSLGGPSAYGVISIDDEEIVYTGSSGANITGCIRGAFGTSAVGHTSGVTAKWRYIAGFDKALQAAVEAIQTALGITGAFNFLSDSGSNGLIARTAQGVATARTLTAGAGIDVANGTGASADPTVTSRHTVNAQTGTTYSYADGDRAKLVTHTNAASIAGTLPQAGASSSFLSGWYMDVENRGAGTLTITPTTSTIDGASTLVLTTNQGARIFSDGTNYFTQRGLGGGSSPLTTKGDLYGFTTVNARVPVGADGQILTADSSQSLGLKFSGPMGVRAARHLGSAVSSKPTSTPYKIDFDTSDVSSSDISYSSGTFTINTPGDYIVSTSVAVSLDVPSTVIDGLLVKIYKNGSSTAGGEAAVPVVPQLIVGGGVGIALPLTMHFAGLAANDTIEIYTATYNSTAQSLSANFTRVEISRIA